MNVEEYYLRLKERKEFGGKFHKRRTTSTQFVTKLVKTTAEWDAERINEYCETILEDGGMQASVTQMRNPNSPINLTFAEKVQYTLKNRKRWDLCDNIKKGMRDQVECRDNWAPHVVIVERHNRRNKRKCDVMHAMFTRLDDTSVSPGLENESSKRECVVKYPVKPYSTTTDLLGHTSRKRDDKNAKVQSMIHPEVMYEFSYVHKDSILHVKKDRHGYERKTTRKCRSRKKRNAIDNSREFEIENEEYWHDGKSSEKVGEEKEDFRSIMEVSLESLITHSATAKKRRDKRKQKASCQQPNETEENSKKGQMIEIPLDMFATKQQRVKESESEQIRVLKVEKKSMESFYFSGGSDCVQFGNIRPVVFTSDLKHEDIQETSSHCLLLFETDFVPDVFPKDNSAFEATHVVTSVSLVCENKDFVKIFNSHLDDLISEVNLLVSGKKIEHLINRVRTLFTNVFTENLSYRHVEKRITNKPCMRNTRIKRLMRVVKDINEQIGLKTESVFPEDEKFSFAKEIDKKKELKKHDEFVFVNEDDSPENCGKCGVNFEKSNRSGVALETCRHWFCRNCWADQVMNWKQICDVKCIKPECQERVNAVSLMFLYNITKEKNKALHGEDEENSLVFECRKIKCRGITKVTSTNSYPPTVASSMLVCKCGTSWCGRCRQNAHAPVSCHVAERYTDEIDALNKNFGFRLFGKFFCMKCRRRITTKNSCSQMNCCCGASFYWDGTPHDCVTVSKKIFFPSHKFAIDFQAAEMRGRKTRNHRKAFSSDDFGYRARLRAMRFLSGAKYAKVDAVIISCLANEFGYIPVKKKEESKDSTCSENRKLMSDVEDLLLVKDEIHYIIPYLYASLAYGTLRQQSQKQLQTLIKKMETLSSTIEYLLLSLEYNSLDSKYPTLFRRKATEGRKLIKNVFLAFYSQSH